ncbi:MAG: SpvB/TcaC N-terminal domain-containing protein [Ferruginibacter sp.]
MRNRKKCTGILIVQLVLLLTGCNSDIAHTYPAENTVQQKENSPVASKTFPPAVMNKTAEKTRHVGERTFKADMQYGIIGTDKVNPVDDAFDNVFHIQLPAKTKSNNTFILQYWLYGVSAHTGISRSINDAQACGGRFVKCNNEWKLQREYISAENLHLGDNIIRFSLPEHASHYYKVKDLAIVETEPASNADELLLSEPGNYFYGKQAYVKGVIKNSKAGLVKLFCNGQPVNIFNNEFEFISDDTGDPAGSELKLKAVFPSGKVIRKNLHFKKSIRPDFVFVPGEKGLKTNGEYSTLAGLKLGLATDSATAVISIPANALPRNEVISVTALRDIDIPALNTDMVNVTKNYAAFRFLPHGSQFLKKANLRIPFDTALIPEGYSTADIKTFFFNEVSKKWEELPLDTIDAAEGMVASLTTHFTDMINGIIKVPESPQTQGYTPTSIKDFKAADPSNGITFINPPEANNNGSASLSFNLKIPAGRLGMQPQLALRYSNEGGNGWMGLGWNISLPFIGIETRWGVPRYDPALETEEYTMSGEQLSPVVHGASFVARATGEKQFHPRVEGAFSRITRKGTGPKDYWWEVTNKNGTKNIYGGANGEGVLKDDEGNIAHWALVETKDLNGNYVKYIYATEENAGVKNSPVKGRQLYIKEIIYTGHGNADGPYKVEFVRKPGRDDIDINCRNGFKMVTADLLDKIKITINGEPVRSYEYSYTPGAFNKTLLQGFSELDAKGEIFYSHSFEYYDDVEYKSGYKPLEASREWSVTNDDIKGDIINPIGAFKGEGSALSTSGSSSINGGLAFTIGTLAGNWFTKMSSIGGQIGLGSDNQEGLVSLIDVNGDGLPDKVFKKDNRLYYRSNNGSDKKSFSNGEPAKLTGTDGDRLNISKGNSSSFSWGLQVNPLIGFLGYNKSSTTTTTTEYFSDFNGDGLIDIAKDGDVYFNRLTADNPEFKLFSTGTPNPITEGVVDKSLLTNNLGMQEEQEKQFPLQDVVRFWQAPFDGNIHIEAPVKLIPGFATDTKRDGVRATIQINDAIVWEENIKNGDESVKPALLDTTVKRNDKIYFRLQSVYNGNGDTVLWNPSIKYTGSLVSEQDANKRSNRNYIAHDDFILHSKSTLGIARAGIINIDGVLKKEITSDTVTLLLIKNNNFSDPVISIPYLPGDIIDTTVTKFDIAVRPNDVFAFILKSNTSIDRTAISWKPHYWYAKFPPPDSIEAIDAKTGKPLIEGYPVPDNSNFNTLIKVTPLMTSRSPHIISVKPNLACPNNTNGSLTFSIKGDHGIYFKRTVQISNGKIAGDVFSKPLLIGAPGEKLYCEYFADAVGFANLFDKVGLIVRDSIDKINPVTGLLYKVEVFDTLNAGLYANPPQEFLGSMYHGWGCFGLKGTKDDKKPFDQDKLNMDEQRSLENKVSDFPDKPVRFDNTASLENFESPSSFYFVPLASKTENNTWSGYDSRIFVAADMMSSARLLLQDIAAEEFMAGKAGFTRSKVSVTDTKSYSIGLADFGVSASIGKSTADTRTIVDVMDMNGDRYPDIVTEGNLQFTKPNGELEQNSIGYTLGHATSKGETGTGISLGGFPQASSRLSKPAEGAQHAEKVAGAAIGFSGNLGSNTDNSISTWMDMNGDGLPDKVNENGDVALNLGYKFSASEKWEGLTKIDNNETTSESVGANGSKGISIDGSSIQAGFSLSGSDGAVDYSLTDVNGDGLPDRIILDNSVLKVSLNTGNGFAPEITWRDYNKIGTNFSVGESINGAFTISLPIILAFIKICINPSGSVGHGVSRRQDQIMDIDGDGFPDLLHSENDGNLTVQSSTIGKTNMLKKVNRPMHSYFTIDYERVGNTYKMPQSKWVLAKTEIYDGHQGEGVDFMRKTFSYKNGTHDRREREFYGFDTVTTCELNTTVADKVYRKNIKVFNNDNYYQKGLLLSEWTENATGNRFTETRNEYEEVPVTGNVIFPALTKTKRLFYEGKPTAGISTYNRYEYDALGNMISIFDDGDGSFKDEMLATIKYHNNDLLYIKSLPEEIDVVTGNAAKRKRVARYDDFGNVKQIDQYITGDSIATFNMEYDFYGNLSQVLRPQNYKGQRMWYKYEYDNVTHGLVTGVSDAFGYKSSSSYDYRFGQLTSTTSMNNEVIRYAIDDKGRISTITGPYEIAANKPYTIAFDYSPEAAVPYAVTKHYDPEYNSDIKTVTFMDGLGRAIQVKKQIALFKNRDMADELQMVVSGKVMFDAFGRSIENYYPVTEGINGSNTAINNSIGKFNSKTIYDVLNRPVTTILADNTVTTMEYTIKDNRFSTFTTDALLNTKETRTDVKERNREVKVNGGSNGTITTQFKYNALSELDTVIDNSGNITANAYDYLGRKISVQHPDAGLTEFVFDAAGNMTTKITPQIRKKMPGGGGIKYQYDYERLSDIDYPFQYQNKVKYIYGDSGSKAGRLVLMQDASGGQEFFYGKLGEVVKTIRTMLISPDFATTFVSEQQYDTWNRIKSMIYPDGDSVMYHYNRGGALQSISSKKLGNEYKYVDRLGYDEYEQRVYLKYGNGTESFYSYDDKRRRLTTLQTFTHGDMPIMNNTYSYDAVSNITGIENNVQAQVAKIGGYDKQEYTYDNLYRLTEAHGVYKGFGINTGYGLKVEYDDLYNIISKQMDDSFPVRRYNQLYTYGGAAPHQPTKIGNISYTYDLNGNLLGDGSSELFWDEENRLMGVIKNGTLSQYTYDAKGERAIKSSGGVQGLWINGSPAGTTKHYDNFTAYVSPYLVYRKAGFTKHFYIENQRIVTKLGNGEFINSSFPISGLTAGGVDYIKRIRVIESARLEWYKSLGMPAAAPTDKTYWLRPENNGIVPPVIVDNTASDVPPGWPSGPAIPREDWLAPVYLPGVPSREEVRAGYGYNGTGLMYEKDQYFYHPDHLGSSSYITDALGEVNQHFEYTPFGETFFEEHASSYKTPYLFNAKEKDIETGLYYYGARYYDARNSLWLSVDPMAEKYPGLSPYNYCLNNPVKMVDPNGKEVVIPNSKDRAAITKMINSKALGEFAIDKSGKLYQAKSTGNSKKYSTYYRDQIAASIKSEYKIEIEIAPKTIKPGLGEDKKSMIREEGGTVYDVDKQAGGGVTFSGKGADITNQLVVISGNKNENLKDTEGNPLVDRPADILLHEIVGHAAPHILGKDSGNAVANENKARLQTGSKERASESGHHE